MNASVDVNIGIIKFKFRVTKCMKTKDMQIWVWEGEMPPSTYLDMENFPKL